MNGSPSAHSEAARSPGGASSSKSTMTSSPADRTTDDEPARKDKRIKRVKKKSKEVRSIIRSAYVRFFFVAANQLFGAPQWCQTCFAVVPVLKLFALSRSHTTLMRVT